MMKDILIRIFVYCISTLPGLFFLLPGQLLFFARKRKFSKKVLLKFNSELSTPLRNLGIFSNETYPPRYLGSIILIGVGHLLLAPSVVIGVEELSMQESFSKTILDGVFLLIILYSTLKTWLFG